MAKLIINCANYPIGKKLSIPKFKGVFLNGGEYEIDGDEDVIIGTKPYISSNDFVPSSSNTSTLDTGDDE